MSTTTQASVVDTTAGDAASVSAAPNRSVWIDSVRGLTVFAVVLFHVWIWVLEPLPSDYWAPAKEGWGYFNSHLGIRMPLLLLISGMLASRAIRSGIRAPKVHLRIATNYYLYVVWLAVLTFLSFTLPAGPLPHRITSVGDALGQLLVPETPLWYVMALAVYALLLALVASAPPWLVLSALTVLSVTSGMFQTPGMWQRILALMIFFAIGVYARDAMWRLEGKATIPRVLVLVILGEALTQWYVRLAPDSLLAGVLDFARLGAFGVAALLLIAILVRIRRVGQVCMYVGQRTLQVYTTHIVTLWVLILVLYNSPQVLDLLASPVPALLAPLVVTSLVTVVGLLARPTLEKLGYLFTMPVTWETRVLRPKPANAAAGSASPSANAAAGSAESAQPALMPAASEPTVVPAAAEDGGLPTEAEVDIRPTPVASDTSELPACSVIVVAYNCSAMLSDQLPGINWAEADARLVIVDNSDDAHERQQTETMCEWYGWDYLPQGRNSGFGAAANAGAQYAIEDGSTSLVLLNPDAWLSAETLTLLVDGCRRRPDTAFSTRIFRPDHRPWFTGGTLDLATGRTAGRIDVTGGPLRWLTGAVLAMSSDLWQRVGGFDEDFFLYWEDVDLGWRIRQSGGHLEVLADGQAFHTVGGTQQVGRKSASYVYYNTRNRLWFAARHLTGEERRPWLRATPRLCWELIGMAGRTPASFWAALRGVWSGLRAMRHAPLDDDPGDSEIMVARPESLVSTGGN